MAVWVVGCGKDSDAIAKATAANAAARANFARHEAKSAEPMPAPADVGAPPADAQVIREGLWSKVLAKGEGQEHPNPWDVVEVHYTGWTRDGKQFVTTLQGADPAKFPEPRKLLLGATIEGWNWGIPEMVVGEKRRFWIDEALAYAGGPKGPPGMVVFDLQLFGIERQPAPPAAPEDVSAPPADAERSASGLVSKVLSPGKGKAHPKADDVVRVHFTGWIPEGRPIGSSRTRGHAAIFDLSKQMSKGWVEGVQLMTVGEKRRLWIPSELAYNGQPGKPQGPLVFDVELLEIISFAPPADVGRVAPGALGTSSGVMSKQLEPGTGKVPPKPSDRLLLHYMGWDEKGKLMETTYRDPTAAVFTLEQLPPGWREVLEHMVKGEKRRVWIPQSVHGSQPGASDGLWTIDIEVMDIVP